jgi:hypothetical protein
MREGRYIIYWVPYKWPISITGQRTYATTAIWTPDTRLSRKESMKLRWSMRRVALWYFHLLGGSDISFSHFCFNISLCRLGPSSPNALHSPDWSEFCESEEREADATRSRSPLYSLFDYALLKSPSERICITLLQWKFAKADPSYL